MKRTLQALLIGITSISFALVGLTVEAQLHPIHTGAVPTKVAKANKAAKVAAKTAFKQGNHTPTPVGGYTVTWTHQGKNGSLVGTTKVGGSTMHVVQLPNGTVKGTVDNPNVSNGVTLNFTLTKGPNPVFKSVVTNVQNINVQYQSKTINGPPTIEMTKAVHITTTYKMQPNGQVVVTKVCQECASIPMTTSTGQSLSYTGAVNAISSSQTTTLAPFH